MFCFRYSFVGISVLHNLYVIHHVRELQEELEVTKESLRDFVLPMACALPKFMFMMVDSIWLKMAFGAGLAVGTALFSTTITLAAVTYFADLYAYRDPKLNRFEIIREMLWFFVGSFFVCLALNLNFDGLCSLEADRFVVWRNTSEQRAEYGINPALNCNGGTLNWAEAVGLACIATAYVACVLFADVLKPFCIKCMEERSFDLGIEPKIAPVETIPAAALTQRNSKVCCGLIDVEEGYEITVEEDSLWEKLQECWPCSIFIFPYIIVFHVILDQVYRCIVSCKSRECCGCRGCGGGRIVAGFYVLFMSAVFYAVLCVPILFGLDLTGCVWGIDRSVLGATIAAFFLCMTDVGSGVALVRNRESPDAVELVFASSTYVLLVGLALAALLTNSVHGDTVVSLGGPGLWSGLLLVIPPFYFFLLWRDNFKFATRQATVLASVWVAFVAFLIILPRYCIIPLCIELDCSCQG